MAKSIYISGGITGRLIEDVEKNFRYAELILHQKGWNVVNPLNIDHQENSTWATYMLTDLAALIPCDAIYMLQDWNKSHGARIEHAFAIAMGKMIYYSASVPTVEHLEFLEGGKDNG